MTDVELLPLHLLEPFDRALKGQRGELDAWLEVNNEADVRLNVEAYVAHATAAQDAQIAQLEKANEQLHAHGERMYAEIEELRVELERWRIHSNGESARRMDAEDRAERLAEALRECIDNREGLAYESEILDRARDLLRAQDAEISPNQDDTREARG